MKKSLTSQRLGLLAVFLMCLFTAAQAQEFWSKGVHYQVLEDGTAEVTYLDNYADEQYNKFESYKGSIDIPPRVDATIHPLYEKPYNISVIVTKIGDNAFRECGELTSIRIPATVTEIGENAFMNCRKLSNVTFLGRIKTIGRAAFYMCTSLKKIDLNEGLEYIDACAFCKSGLTEVSFPSSLRGLDWCSFYGCEGLTEVIVPENIKELPDVFAFCTNLKTVHLPNTLTMLEGTFRGCTALETITIPNSVNTLMFDAFKDCTSLTDIVIPNSVNKLYSGCLDGCTNLQTLVFGRNVTFDHDYFTIYDSPNLYSITSLALHPQRLYHHAFDDEVFKNATLYVPFGSSLEYRCTEYWNKFANIVDLPYSVEENGIYYMIAGANKVSVCHGPMDNHYSGDFVIPEWIYIGDVKYDVVGIENDAFRGVDLLPNDDLKSVEIPSSVTYIGACAFMGCTKLAEIGAERVVTINFKAFYGCESLYSVSLGFDLKQISFSAFDGCPNLSSFWIRAQTPPRITESTFMPEHYGRTWVHVMGVSTSKSYKKAENWKNFENIVTRDYHGGEEIA